MRCVCFFYIIEQVLREIAFSKLCTHTHLQVGIREQLSFSKLKSTNLNTKFCCLSTKPFFLNFEKSSKFKNFRKFFFKKVFEI